jgi:chromate reductase
MTTYRVGYFVGSLATHSINRTLSKALIRLAPPDARKPSAVIGASPGALGTGLAQQSLRGVLSFCDSPQMNAPEAYVRFKPDAFTSEGEVVDEHTKHFLRNFMEEFRDHVVRVLTVLPRET